METPKAYVHDTNHSISHSDGGRSGGERGLLGVLLIIIYEFLWSNLSVLMLNVDALSALTIIFGCVFVVRIAVNGASVNGFTWRCRLEYRYGHQTLQCAAAIGRIAIQSHQTILGRTFTIRIDNFHLLTICHRHFVRTGCCCIVGNNPGHLHNGRLQWAKEKKKTITWVK